MTKNVISCKINDISCERGGTVMNISEIKALVLDDDVTKGMKVTRILKVCGVDVVAQVEDQESGFDVIYRNKDGEKKVSLIITDMHYPLEKGAKADVDAGKKMIERVKKENLEIPVIVFSSVNYDIPGALETIWFSDNVNWEDKLRQVVRKMQ